MFVLNFCFKFTFDLHKVYHNINN